MWVITVFKTTLKNEARHQYYSGRAAQHVVCSSGCARSTAEVTAADSSGEMNGAKRRGMKLEEGCRGRRTTEDDRPEGSEEVKQQCSSAEEKTKVETDQMSTQSTAAAFCSAKSTCK